MARDVAKQQFIGQMVRRIEQDSHLLTLVVADYQRYASGTGNLLALTFISLAISMLSQWISALSGGMTDASIASLFFLFATAGLLYHARISLSRMTLYKSILQRYEEQIGMPKRPEP